MATEPLNSGKEAEISECNGEEVVTMMDVLQEQEEYEEQANAVLGGSDDKNCTYSMGYVKRQVIHACLTCSWEAQTDPSKRAGICLACSLHCHKNHELIELYTKRNFRCDCGNSKLKSQPCQFTPDKAEINEENEYNQNFSGIYCVCHRPYPDPEAETEDQMIQCTICEDWLHSEHLEAELPHMDLYAEMICKTCMEKNEFLHDYSEYAVHIETTEVDVTNISSFNATESNNDLETLSFGVLEPAEANDCDMEPNIGIEDVRSDACFDDPQISISEVTGQTSEEIKVNGLNDENTPLETIELVTSETNNVTEESETVKQSEILITGVDSTDMAEAIDENVDENNSTTKNNEINMTEQANDNIAGEIDKLHSSTKAMNSELDVNTDISDENKLIDTDTLNNRVNETENTENKIVDEIMSNPVETDTNVPEASDESNEKDTENNSGDEMDKEIDEAVESNNKSLSDIQEGDSKETQPGNDVETLQNYTAQEDSELNIDKVEDGSKNELENNLTVETTNEPIKDVSTVKDEDKKIGESNSSEQNIIQSAEIDEKVEDSPGTSNIPNVTENGSIDRGEAEKTADINNVGEVGDEPPIDTADNNLQENLDESADAIDTLESVTKELCELTADMVDPQETSNLETKDGEIPDVITSEEKPIETNAKDDKNEVSNNIDTENINDNKEITAGSSLEKEITESPTELSSDHKRKLDEPIQETEAKKPRTEKSNCKKPQGVKRIFKGATFWPSTFREKLCTCCECLTMYRDLKVLFLLDPEDTVIAYEALGKQKYNGEPTSQYERGMQALSSLNRVQQINALTEYNNLKDKLLDFLKTLKDKGDIVTEDHIREFFAGMKARREPDGVYFCR